MSSWPNQPVSHSTACHCELNCMSSPMQGKCKSLQLRPAFHRKQNVVEQVTGENPLTTKFFYTEVILKTTRVLLWVVKMGPEIYNHKTKTTTMNQQLVLERQRTNAPRPKSPTVTLTWHGNTQKVHKLQQRHTLKDEFHKWILFQLAGHTWHLEKMSSCVTWTLKAVRTSSTWSRRPWLRTS